MKYLSEVHAADLMEQAKVASLYTYSPYSHFAVGAALLTKDGKVYTGANLENASYGLTICAERTAIGHARAAGAGPIVAIAVWSAGESLSPCGACRQFILEFGRDIVVVFKDRGQNIQKTAGELLPFAFDESDLI